MMNTLHTHNNKTFSSPSERAVSISLVPKCSDGRSPSRRMEYSFSQMVSVLMEMHEEESKSWVIQGGATAATKPPSNRQQAASGTCASVTPRIVGPRDSDSASSENSLQISADKQRIS